MSERQQVILEIPTGAVLPDISQRADNTKQLHRTALTLKVLIANANNNAFTFMLNKKLTSLWLTSNSIFTDALLGS